MRRSLRDLPVIGAAIGRIHDRSRIARLTSDIVRHAAARGIDPPRFSFVERAGVDGVIRLWLSRDVHDQERWRPYTIGSGLPYHEWTRWRYRAEKDGRLPHVDWDDVPATIAAVVDSFVPYARHAEADRQIGRHQYGEVRLSDGRIRRIPYHDRQAYAWKGHPAIVGVARALGIPDGHLAAAPGNDDGSIAETTPWPERTYWRIHRRRLDEGQFGVEHRIVCGYTHAHRQPGLVQAESRDRSMTVEIVTRDRLPEAVRIACAGRRLGDLIAGFELPDWAAGGDGILEVEEKQAMGIGPGLTCYVIRVEPATYVPLARWPEGMDMAWMDDGWGSAGR